MEEVATLVVVDKVKPKWKYKSKKEIENEAMEAQIPELTKMGKEMNAFHQKEEHMGLHHGSRVSLEKKEKERKKNKR